MTALLEETRVTRSLRAFQDAADVMAEANKLRRLLTETSVTL